jgi:hypothetical protein
MKNSQLRVEIFDTNTDQCTKKGTAEFVSWSRGLLELRFANDLFTFEPNLAHLGDERSRLWSSVGERGFGNIRIAGLLDVLSSHGLSASPLRRK